MGQRYTNTLRPSAKTWRLPTISSGWQTPRLQHTCSRNAMYTTAHSAVQYWASPSKPKAIIFLKGICELGGGDGGVPGRPHPGQAPQSLVSGETASFLLILHCTSVFWMQITVRSLQSFQKQKLINMWNKLTLYICILERINRTPSVTDEKSAQIHCHLTPQGCSEYWI